MVHKVKLVLKEYRVFKVLLVLKEQLGLKEYKVFKVFKV